MQSYWNKYPTIKHKLDDVHKLIEAQFTVRNEEIQQTLINFSQSGGKMLRPVLFFLFADLGNKKQQNQQQLTQIAASLEILHMATLIHDDIIDDSPLRRGAVTVQAKYGKDIAVYAGDLLFTEFFTLLTEAMNGSEFLAINAKSMRRLLVGELDQMHTRYKADLSFKEYLRSVNGKTAELFWLACLEGAHFGQTDERTQRRAARIGRNIGLAFQIYDDILDYTAEEAVLQKPILEDLAQGVYTLPLILARRENPEAFAPYLAKKNQLTIEEAKEVQQLVVQYQGVEQAKIYAQRFTTKALEDIDRLPKGIAQKQIKALTKKLLARTY